LKKVIVFGTFDILHKGHEYFLKQAKTYGEKLIVIVGRDGNVIKFKKKAPVQNEKQRLQKIRNLKYVDMALLGKKDHDYMKLLKQFSPEVICLGYDQDDFGLRKEITNNNLNIKVKRISPYKPDLFKSSILRELVNL